MPPYRVQKNVHNFIVQKNRILLILKYLVFFYYYSSKP